MSVSVRNVAFALAGVFAAMYTIAMPHGGSGDSGSYAAGQLVGSLVFVFGIPVLLRLIYVKVLRRRAQLPLMSGWVLVMAVVIAFMASSGSNS